MAECEQIGDNPFQKLKHLGDGAHGSVYLVNHRIYGIVAYKECWTSKENHILDKLEKEACRLRTLRHPNIVVLYGASFNSSMCGLFMEYMKYGAVSKFLKDFQVPSEWRLQIVWDIASAMLHLHEMKPIIVHGDLTCQNILIGEGYRAKIADFGLACIASEKCGKSEKESEKFDVFCFAYSAFDILRRNKTDCFCTVANLTTDETVERPDMRDLNETVPSRIINVIADCWHRNENKRPSFVRIEKKFSTQVSKMKSELKCSYSSLIEQEQNMSQSAEMQRSGLSAAVVDPVETETDERNRSTDTGNATFRRQLSLHNVIGEGGYGVVYRAHHPDLGLVAYKKLHVQFVHESDKPSLKQEADLHQTLNHPNIIKCLGAFLEPGNYGIIFELAEHGELRNYLKENNEWKTKLKMLHEVASGMNYLHNKPNPVIHGDLKIQNVLVGENNRAKICDFGFSQWKNYSQSRSVHDVRRGTITHIPPEYWRDSKLRKTEKFDVYSFGICAWEIITLERPFESAAGNHGIIGNWVSNGHRPSIDLIPKNVPYNIIKLLYLCWDQSSGKRPEFKYVVDVLKVCNKQKESRNSYR